MFEATTKLLTSKCRSQQIHCHLLVKLPFYSLLDSSDFFTCFLTIFPCEVKFDCHMAQKSYLFVRF